MTKNLRLSLTCRTRGSHEEADRLEGDILEFDECETESDFTVEESELEPEINVRDEIPFFSLRRLNLMRTGNE